MENWILAMIPPLLVWLGVWWYSFRTDRRLREVEDLLAARESK